MSKALSTTTLSLRFMQNAQRKNQVQEAQLQKAVVKDEAEWEISSATRSEWAASTSSTHSVTHEASYLPFLQHASEAESKPKGRRVFKKGHEIDQSAPEVSTSAAKPTPTAPSPEPESMQLQKSSPPQKPKGAKSARAGIFDTTGVGFDLSRKPRKQLQLIEDNDDDPSLAAPSTKATPSVPPTFLKPAGVDEPKTMTSQHNDTPITARAVTKSKRDRTTEGEGETAKPKKKKRKDKPSA